MLEDAFRKNILEQPDDDLVRLAYADWLLERGDEDSTARGERIQVQCQIARRAEGGPGQWAVSLADLEAREADLLARHGERWAFPVRKFFVSCEFRRGFIESVTATVPDFLRQAGDLFRLAPVQRVRFLSTVTGPLANSPHLARLTEIDLSRQQIGDVGLRTLLGSRHLKRLRALDLSYCRLTNVSAQALAASPVLGQLTTLNLSHNALSMDGVRALYASPHWNGLNNLLLNGNAALDARTVQFLSQSLQGNPDPSLLRSLLRLSSRGTYDYSSASVRDLARRANAGEPAQVLGEGLRASHRKLRSAAAQMLSQLGAEALPGVPLLVQRLFESNRLVRDHAAPALARLLPTLPAEAQAWLCLLANPHLPPLANLRTTLASSRLPVSVREDFALVRARRIAWRQHIAGGQAGRAPVPDPATVNRSSRSVSAMIVSLGELAERHAMRHKIPQRMPLGAPAELTRTARDKEHAWLLARLCELLLAAVPAPKKAKARKR